LNQNTKQSFYSKPQEGTFPVVPTGFGARGLRPGLKSRVDLKRVFWQQKSERRQIMRTFFLSTVLTVLALAWGPLLRADDSSLPNDPGINKRATDAIQANQRQEKVQSESATVPTTTFHLSRGAVPAATGRYFQFDKDATDRKYWSLTVAMFGVSIANAELTERCQAEKTCNFLPSVVSNRAGKYGIGIPADLALAYMSYRLKKDKHKWTWILPEAFSTGINFYVGIHSWNRLR
jgi:hypothetical protein